LQKQHTFISITALWAFVEAGLGGFLHAFHLPFTGIVLGGFAVLMISLLAQFSEKPFTQIIQATLIVVAIKAIANPATSPMAYIAVGFQGLLGALIFSVHKNHYLSYFLFATISMLESGAQKLLVMMVLFGKSFRQGITGLGKQVHESFGMALHNTNTIIIIYLSIFFVWGILLSIWMFRLPAQIQKRKNDYFHITASEELLPSQKKKNNFFIFLLLVIVLLTIFVNNQNAWIVGIVLILRVLAILFIWQMVILPIWQTQMIKWSNKQKLDNPNFNAVQKNVQEIKNITKPLYAEVAKKYSGFTKMKEFLLGLIVVTLYPNNAK
jgi:hypothetical protein